MIYICYKRRETFIYSKMIIKNIILQRHLWKTYLKSFLGIIRSFWFHDLSMINKKKPVTKTWEMCMNTGCCTITEKDLKLLLRRENNLAGRGVIFSNRLDISIWFPNYSTLFLFIRIGTLSRWKLWQYAK